jgi:hypothetical protein
MTAIKITVVKMTVDKMIVDEIGVARKTVDEITCCPLRNLMVRATETCLNDICFKVLFT